MVVGELSREVDLLVIGAGPGGYVAAAHGADAGLATAVIESAAVPGGVCLREGCIPSKALLHIAKVIDDATHAGSYGVEFAEPKIDVEKLRGWKNRVITRLSGGVAGLLKNRKVEYLAGTAVFEDSRTVRIDGPEISRIKFKNAIIATGSRAKMLPASVIDPALVWDAAGALELSEIPGRLLVVGGGYIGLELGQVYASLGSKVTVVEALDALAPAADPELMKPLAAKLNKQFEAIYLKAALKGGKKKGEQVEVEFEIGGEMKRELYDRVLVSIGRRPNSDTLGLEKTKVKIDAKGFIVVDPARRTTDHRIFAIGDVACEPMLAHKAMHEAKVAVDAIKGKPAAFEPNAIPGVIYTDPELAWCGVTEREAKEAGMDYKVTRFPWAASGRAVAMGRTDGLTKMIFDAKSERLIGVGIVGAHAGDLISEGVLAVENAMTAEEIGASIHPHPATSETIGESAEALLGHGIHVSG